MKPWKRPADPLRKYRGGCRRLERHKAIRNSAGTRSSRTLEPVTSGEPRRKPYLRQALGELDQTVAASDYMKIVADQVSP